MKRLVYTGSAPGQAEVIQIGDQRFERGATYEVDDEEAVVLVGKGGFYDVEEFEVLAPGEYEAEAETETENQPPAAIDSLLAEEGDE